MKKSAWVALILAGVLIVLGIILVGVAAALTNGGLRQLFTEEMTWDGPGWPWNYQNDNGGRGQTPGEGEDYQTQTWLLPEGETLDTVICNGVIRDITVRPGDSFSISYPESSREHYSIEYRDGQLQVDGAYQGQGSLLWQARDWDIIITVPEGCAPGLELSMAAGDVEIVDVTVGDMLVASAAGDVELNRVQGLGSLDISSTAGDIDLTDVICAGSIIIGATAGSSDLLRTETPLLSMDITAGDVELEKLAATRAEIQVVAGDVYGTVLGDVEDYYVSLQRTVRGESYGDPNSPCSLAVTTTAGDIDISFVTE